MVAIDAAVVLVVDPAGRLSEIRRAVRRAGHRTVTVTGPIAALVLVEVLVPDLAIVRVVDGAPDHRLAARLRAVAPEMPVRFVSRPDDVAAALESAWPFRADGTAFLS